MSENRDLARSLLAAARRRANKFSRERGQRDNQSRDRQARDGGATDGENHEYQGPALISESLTELIAQRGWREKMRDSDLFIRWSELVGKELADHVQPISFTDGLLTVSAESTAWATQLRLIEQELQATLRTGGFEVREILVKGPQAPSWRKGGWSVKGGRGPRDTYG